jgi:hypothetical protein
VCSFLADTFFFFFFFPSRRWCACTRTSRWRCRGWTRSFASRSVSVLCFTIRKASPEFLSPIQGSRGGGRHRVQLLSPRHTDPRGKYRSPP